MRIIVDPLGRKETPHGIFDKVRSGAYEMVLAVSHYCRDWPLSLSYHNSVWHEAVSNKYLVLMKKKVTLNTYLSQEYFEEANPGLLI
jgi:hypothetical protein